MIVIRLSGGLGNQLFQYAFGKNLSIKNRALLKFETSDYQNDFRKYALDKFNIPESASRISTDADLSLIGIPQVFDKSLYGKIRRKLFRSVESLRPIYQRRFIIEPYFHFCADVLKITGNCYLSGVWQSEKYFKENGDIIKRELSLKKLPTISTQNWTKQISECNSVSLHIRRGDYVHDQKTNKLHGTCGIEYYKEAMNLISQKIKDPVFFIFSDDPQWARENLKSSYPLFIVSNGEIPDYEELTIMSKCKHNIIANSSFSWWGAWLNENKNKLVIAPQKWFNAKNINTDDLLPTSWIRI